MRENPLVSVIIPCYNSEKYVAKAIQSIINQTYRNLEILIVNDCSTDGTYRILKDIEKLDSRIKIINNSRNLKIVKNLNFLISISKGKYIARMDSDDFSFPKRIEKQVLFLEKHNDYSVCGCNSYIIDDNDKCKGFSLLPKKNVDIQKYKIWGSPFFHPGVLIRKTIFNEFLYEDSYLYAEDYALWMKILLKYKGYNLSGYYLAYRVYNEQTSDVHKLEQTQITKRIISDYNDIILPSFVNNFIFYIYEAKKLTLKEKINFFYIVRNKLPNHNLIVFKRILSIYKFSTIFFFPIWMIKNSFYIFLYIIRKKIYYGSVIK